MEAIVMPQGVMTQLLHPRPAGSPRAGLIALLIALSSGVAAAVVVAAIVPSGSPTRSASPSVAQPAGKQLQRLSAVRPYDAHSPWNTPIASAPAIDPRSSVYVGVLTAAGLPLSSDPDEYTIPVYIFSRSTQRYVVYFTGCYGTYDQGDRHRVGHGCPARFRGGIPIPPGTAGGIGSDGQLEIWNPSTGVEYGFWQFSRDASLNPHPGHFVATNGYRYHTTRHYFGRFADGQAGRGDGTPYLAGLVRPWEIAQGHIDHALAFGFEHPASSFVYPASKSDGGSYGGDPLTNLPEGTHLQLDPRISDTRLLTWGLSDKALVIAHALQRYGMFLVDHSGSSKIYVEDRATAHWGFWLGRQTLSGIPWSAFRVVDTPR
jgi:hypothetical protein